MEALARFHRGRASLVATFPANLFHGRGRGKRGRRTLGNSTLVISAPCNIYRYESFMASLIESVQCDGRYGTRREEVAGATVQSVARMSMSPAVLSTK